MFNIRVVLYAQLIICLAVPIFKACFSKCMFHTTGRQHMLYHVSDINRIIILFDNILI